MLSEFNTSNNYDSSVADKEDKQTVVCNAKPVSNETTIATPKQKNIRKSNNEKTRSTSTAKQSHCYYTAKACTGIQDGSFFAPDLMSWS